MSWKERLLRSLPLVAALAGTTTFMVTEEQWALLIAITGVWLMDSPIPGTVAVVSALKRRPDVSRETSTRRNVCVECRYKHSPDEPHRMDTLKIREPNVSRETMAVPCVVMHGSAEPHVEGCEGWTFESH